MVAHWIKNEVARMLVPISIRSNRAYPAIPGRQIVGVETLQPGGCLAERTRRRTFRQVLGKKQSRKEIDRGNDVVPPRARRPGCKRRPKRNVQPGNVRNQIGPGCCLDDTFAKAGVFDSKRVGMQIVRNGDGRQQKDKRASERT